MCKVLWYCIGDICVLVGLVNPLGTFLQLCQNLLKFVHICELLYLIFGEGNAIITLEWQRERAVIKYVVKHYLCVLKKYFDDKRSFERYHWFHYRLSYTAHCFHGSQRYKGNFQCVIDQPAEAYLCVLIVHCSGVPFQ